jgi:hypothetical protein
MTQALDISVREASVRIDCRCFRCGGSKEQRQNRPFENINFPIQNVYS